MNLQIINGCEETNFGLPTAGTDPGLVDLLHFSKFPPLSIPTFINSYKGAFACTRILHWIRNRTVRMDTSSFNLPINSFFQ